MFDDFETSNSNGRPIALYQIRWGTQVWQYTSADTVQYYPDDSSEGNRFLPVSIRDNGMTQGGSTENDFQLDVQSDLPVVGLYGDSAPTGKVWLTVRRKHADDPDNEAPVYFVGNISNVVRGENTAEASVRAIALTKQLKSGGLRQTWGKNCPHCIYDSGCRVNPLLHEYAATVSAIVGSSVTMTADLAPSEGTFTGGFIEWTRSGQPEKRGIEVQASARTVKVFGRVPGLAVGAVVKLFPGCDQTVSTCDGGFDNIDNNGGFFFLPEKSPFDGTQVFD